MDIDQFFKTLRDLEHFGNPKNESLLKSPIFSSGK